MTLDEWHEAHEALIEHPDVIAALAKRGITDLDLVLIDTWAYGHSLIPAEFRDRRVGWTDVWRRSTPNGSPYANPVDGLHFVVDMNTMELLRIEDDAPPAGGSPMGEYRPDLVPGLVQRRDVKALEIIQPEGPSVHPRRQRAALAELDDAAGLQPPRGPGHPPRGLPGRRRGAADRAPALVRRDGRPLPRPEPPTTTGAPPSTSASGAWAS